MPKPEFRFAVLDDLPRLVALLADDPLGARRERNVEPLPQGYRDAFAAIESDDNNELIVALLDGGIAGMLQITFIPYLTYQGGWRALIEGVRVAQPHRGKGLGKQLFEWAIRRAKERNCHLVQLTTDKSRPDALKFYTSLGFVASHEGMKLYLE